jgi:hypothetical protein
MPRSPRRQVVVLLSREEWRLLCALATDAERDPFQQARFMLVQQLREHETVPEIEADPEPAELAV